MPTFVLNRGDSLTLPHQPLHLSARIVRSGTPARLGARLVGGPPMAGARHPNPELMILPSVAEPTVVRVSPSDTDVFAERTTVTLHLWTDDVHNAEQIVVLVNGVDASGLGSCDLLVLGPTDEGVTVTAVESAGDEPVGGLAARVRSEAWSRLRISELGAPARSDLAIGIDVSSSMLASFVDGSVAALVEAVVGVSFVVGRPPGRVRACLLGQTPTWLPEMPGHELPDAVIAAVRRSGLECGFRPWTATPPVAEDGRSVFYVLTDAEPPDAGAFAAATATDGVIRHLIISGCPPLDTESSTEPRSDSPSLRSPRTVVEPPTLSRRPATVTTAAADDLQEPSSGPRLTALVSSLLAPWTSDVEEIERSAR